MPDKYLTNTASLGFGRFAASGGGAIGVNVNGARTRSGSVVLLASSTSPASFTISSKNPGNDNKIYVLTLPANGSVSLVSGSHSMAVNNFVSDYPAGSPLPAASQTVRVGAVLQVAPNQAPGSYTGSFNVTLEYQ